jgi:chromosomal replication initiator protein
MKDINLHEIAQEFAHYHRYAFDLLRSKSRKRPVVQVRHQILAFMHDNKHRFETTRISKSLRANKDVVGDRVIGAVLCRDHASVLHARKTVQNLCDTDSKFKAEYEKFVEFGEKYLMEYFEAPEPQEIKQPILIDSEEDKNCKFAM